MKDRFAAIRERGAIVVDTIASSAVAQVLVILWLHTVLYARLFRHAPLWYPQYFEPYLVVEAGHDLGLVALATLPFLVLFLARRHTRWEDIDPKRRTRWVVWIIAGIFAWSFSTYDVNLFFDQSHWLDRLLLVALWVAIYFHPMALVPFLVMTIMIVAQEHFPLPEGPWTWPDKRLPLDLLIVFASYTLVTAVLRARMKPYVLPLLFLCITGMTYGHAAVNKVLLGPSWNTWLLHDDLGNLFVASHVHSGWLRGLSDDRIISIAHVLHAVKVPLALITILTEGSGFLLVIRWGLTRLLLPGFVAFHIAILASSGIFFWKWMVCDLLLLWYLSRLRRDDGPRVAPLFTPRVTALALAVMIAARFYFDLVPFAWFDTKLINYFEIYGVADSGHRYRLDARFFAPYDVHIQQGRHYSTVKGPVLVGTFGTTLDPRVMDALETAKPEDLPELRKLGQRWTSEYWAFGFFEFVRRYVDNAQRRGGRRSVVSWIAPPFHFRTTAPDDVFDFQEHLSRVEIEFREYLYDGKAITLTRQIPIISFPVDRPITQPR